MEFSSQTHDRTRLGWWRSKGASTRPSKKLLKLNIQALLNQWTADKSFNGFGKKGLRFSPSKKFTERKKQKTSEHTIWGTLQFLEHERIRKVRRELKTFHALISFICYNL